MVVRAVVQDTECTVNLFGHYEPHQLVRKYQLG